MKFTFFLVLSLLLAFGCREATDKKQAGKMIGKTDSIPVDIIKKSDIDSSLEVSYETKWQLVLVLNVYNNSEYVIKELLVRLNYNDSLTKNELIKHTISYANYRERNVRKNQAEAIDTNLLWNEYKKMYHEKSDSAVLNFVNKDSKSFSRIYKLVILEGTGEPFSRSVYGVFTMEKIKYTFDLDETKWSYEIVKINGEKKQVIH